MSLGQSDVPGPEGPTAVARIPGEGGARIGGGEEDRRAAQQLGEEEEKEAGSTLSSWSCDLTKGLYFLSFSKSGGRTETPTVQQKTLTLKERGNFLCGETLTTGACLHLLFASLSLATGRNICSDSTHRTQGRRVPIFCRVII